MREKVRKTRMNEQKMRLRNAGFVTFFFSGICAISSGVVVSLLQEQYGFAYGMTGTLLSLMSIGNLLAGFLTGVLPGVLGLKPSVLLLTIGYTLGYGIMGFTGAEVLLAAAFFLVGIAKGSAMNACTILVSDNSADRTRGMNLMHSCYACGALLCPFLIAAAAKVSTSLAVFLLAALVCITTMTRMVDENRLQMGTLKALGYSNTMIAGKYLLYGLAASVSGSIFGMVVGFIVFPTIIWQAYQTMMFQIPTFSLQFYPGMAAGSVLLSAAVIGIATWESCRASLKEKTAALLLPRAPVAGKRIFLEYITPLWKHMSFSQKTTARNLFRYKKRFFMTVLGVAGCTALLLIGFGIQDSILPMLTKQTTELNHSDLTISLSDEKAFTVENGVIDVLDASADVTSFGRFYTKSVTLYNADGDQQTISLVAAEDESQMTDYFTFRTRQGHKAISFDDSSVILTEKTAELLGLAVGDPFEVELSDGSRQTLTLTGITENYVFTRLYLSQTQLKRLTGGTLPAWNTLYAQTSCPDTDARNALRTDLLACNYVGSVSFIEDTTEMFDNLIGCLNYVVILVIVCAAALAAVVLYNLISVNLGERKKELATIKVLGFYDKEVYRYIFREIDLLALIGSLVGLALGVPLHQFIIRTVEMDQMMFIRAAAPRSYLFSVALTLFFTVVVCRLMRRHIKKISMVESMKAPE